MRRARDWVVAARAMRRLREAAARRGAPLTPSSGPGAPPRPAARPRPAEDRAVRSRLGRWRDRGGRPAAPAPAALTAAEVADAMRTLATLRQQMGEAQGARIDAHLERSEVAVRRLRPEDGYVWEMPGMRVFAIVGVQAFSVEA
jgi:hypothetical protein